MHRHLCTTLSVLLVGALASVGCGDAEIGEECDDVGATSDCENGAICTNEDGRGVCRKLCKDTVECPAGHACNGVAGTNLKSCQQDKPKV